jgi:multiple sugar transport system permease protein
MATSRRTTSRRRLRYYLMAALRYGLLALGAFIMVLPFAEMFLGALRTPAERLARPPVFWPRDPQWQVYVDAFTELPMLRWYANSVVVTCSITLLQLATSAMAGFALAKYQFRGRTAMLRTVLAAQMFPFFLFLIPLFMLMRFFPLAGGNTWLGQGGSGLLGSYAALILPFMVTWYGIFLMRQFMLNVPDTLLDAARIDGCSEWGLFARIVLPLVRPALATLGIFVFIYHWNEFIWTMTITRSAQDLQTLPVGIYLLRGVFQQDLESEALQQAALAVSTVPVAVLFLLLQRYYVRGLNMSGIKE